MKPSVLRLALALSLLVNLGVIGALGYRALQPGAHTVPAQGSADAASLVRHLELSKEQLRKWRADEAQFLDQLAAGAAQIRVRRDRLIDEIFAELPDHAAIEAERAAIAELQDAQQQLVIAQLLRERDLLDARQRALLAQVLRAQPIGHSDLEQLHHRE